MSWIDRSQPPEAEDPPPAPTADTAIADLAAERDDLRSKVRRGIRSRHQDRILRRIAEITRMMLKGTNHADDR